MKPIALVCFLVASAFATNPYGTVKVSYGSAMPEAAPITFSKMPDMYNAPVRAASVPVRSAPVQPCTRTAAAPVRSSYEAPAAPVRSSYEAPAAPVRSSYEAPAAPVRSSYEAPVRAAAESYGSYGSSTRVAAPIPIVRYNAAYNEDGSASHDYATGHGISHNEHTAVRYNPGARGTPEDPLAGTALITKTGSVSYTSPEGHPISLNYVADEHGFRATGDHLPTPPPIPAEIQQALAMIRTAASAASSYGYSSSSSSQVTSGESSYGHSAPAATITQTSYEHSAPAPAPAASVTQTSYGHSTPAATITQTSYGHSAPAATITQTSYEHSAPAPAPAATVVQTSYGQSTRSSGCSAHEATRTQAQQY